MASKSKEKSSKKQEEQEAFDQERAARAASQGLTAPGAVPEQRPQAFMQPAGNESEAFERRKESGALEPMPKKAFDRAASASQLEQAEDEEEQMGSDTLREGARVRIIDGIYEGSEGVVTEVEYDGFEEKQKATSGDPAISRFARAASYMVRTRGSSHALVPCTPDEVESIAQLAGTNTQGA